MNLTRKNIITFIIIGILVPGISLIILCSAYCVSIDPTLDSPMNGGCPFSYDPFVDIAVVFSALLALPFAGFFLLGTGNLCRLEFTGSSIAPLDFPAK